MYVIGVDAGGTKTQCLVTDENGQICGEGIAGRANHQVCGIEETIQSLESAVHQALNAAGLTMADIAYGVFGMAGADEPDDFEILNPAVKRVMGDVDFQVVHDSWIGFYSANVEDMGVVSICGTGAGHGGINRQGERLTLRNLEYITGNYGGGADLVEKALHYAFRSEEKTGDFSMLEKRVPEIFNVQTMEEVCAILKHQELLKEQKYQLPILVFTLANEGDLVCQKLLMDMGYEEGRYAAGIIRRLHMEQEQVPVVLIGSLFKTGNSYLIDSYMKAVREAAKDAYPVIPKEAPVKGAVKMALNHLKR